ncbi:MAG: hypothetical protein COA45_05210 [Zetaproteobacteria bacterium]|nr:MAG: hypothetical protein COA45_05210 [Zetaproteobacteria bacterium]
MAHPFKSYKLIVIFIFLCVTVVGGLYQLHIYNQHQNEIRIQQLKAEQTRKKAERAALDILLHKYLVTFKADLKKKALAYKKSRTVLREILSPYNFETPQYTKENYMLFKNNVAPDLRNKATEIIYIFEKYTKNLQNDIQEHEHKIQEIFLLKWKEMSHKQLNTYIDFFTKEEKLIQAYEEIITFYYIHSNLFSVDLDQNIFLFDREKDKKKEMALRKTIKDLKKQIKTKAY